METNIKELKSKDVGNVDFNKLSLFVPAKGEENVTCCDVLVISKVTSYEKLNELRTPLYYKKINGDGNEYELYCISYQKLVDENTIGRYDLSWNEVPNGVKEYMQKNEYQLSVSVKYKHIL